MFERNKKKTSSLFSKTKQKEESFDYKRLQNIYNNELMPLKKHSTLVFFAATRRRKRKYLHFLLTEFYDESK
jgi:hypothetical protein